jgi:hypothetical protein
MHHMTLKSAIEKYLPLVKEGKSEADIKSTIAEDEKNFTPEEVDEIYTAALLESQAGATEKETKSSKKHKAETKHTICEEWRMEFTPDGKENYTAPDGTTKQRTKWKCEKLKKLRDNVKLPAEMIETLNGDASQNNPVMYFPKK